jgi:hypothetical protein
MKKRQVYCALLAVYIVLSPVYSHDTNTEIDDLPENKNYVLATGNALLSNITLFSINRFIGQTEFSKISGQSIYDNLTGPWQWDSSTFHVNQLGHPYQGYTYYTSGRANNLNPFESTLVTILGSYTWEVFGERVTGAKNDLIVTTLGGISLGEIFHRIYLDTRDHNRILATCISPMDAFTELVTGTKQASTHSKITSASLSPFINYLVLDNIRDNEQYAKHSFHTLAAGVNFSLEYGDPFASRTRNIFDHFTLLIELEGGVNWYDTMLVSDGVLFSWTPEYNGSVWKSYGLYLHYDYYSGRIMDFSANSLSLGMRRDTTNKQGLSYSFRSDAGMILFGSSSFARNETNPDKKTEIRRDYGYGGMIKLALDLCLPAGVTFSLSSAQYYMTILPDTVPDSDGSVLFTRSALSIKHQMNEQVAVGTKNSLTWKKTNREFTSDHRKYAYKISTFLEYSL